LNGLRSNLNDAFSNLRALRSNLKIGGNRQANPPVPNIKSTSAEQKIRPRQLFIVYCSLLIAKGCPSFYKTKPFVSRNEGLPFFEVIWHHRDYPFIFVVNYHKCDKIYHKSEQELQHFEGYFAGDSGPKR